MLKNTEKGTAGAGPEWEIRLHRTAQNGSQQHPAGVPVHVHEALAAGGGANQGLASALHGSLHGAGLGGDGGQVHVADHLALAHVHRLRKVVPPWQENSCKPSPSLYTVTVGPGTLYAMLGRFEEKGIIRLTASEGRRKSHVITDEGLSELRKEYDRLQRMVEDGKFWLVTNRQHAEMKSIKIVKKVNKHPDFV